MEFCPSVCSIANVAEPVCRAHTCRGCSKEPAQAVCEGAGSGRLPGLALQEEGAQGGFLGTKWKKYWFVLKMTSLHWYTYQMVSCVMSLSVGAESVDIILAKFQCFIQKCMPLLTGMADKIIG